MIDIMAIENLATQVMPSITTHSVRKILTWKKTGRGNVSII